MSALAGRQAGRQHQQRVVVVVAATTTEAVVHVPLECMYMMEIKQHV
jgi:hypothetical protein